MSRSDALGRHEAAYRPFAGVDAFAAFWERSGEAALTLQGAFLRDLMGSFGRAPDEAGAASLGMKGRTGPEAEALRAASRAYERSWSTALEVAETTLSNLRDNLPETVRDDEALRDILDPRAWFPAGGPDGGPGLDGAEAFAAKADAAARAAIAFRRRGMEHEVVLIEAWMRSAGTFARHLRDAALAGAKEPVALAALWRDTAERTLDELRRAPAFAASMRAFVDAAADLEAARSALGDTFAEMHGLPSRAELDGLRASVARLEREVRELKRVAVPENGEAP